jgi:hypothetical protein
MFKQMKKTIFLLSIIFLNIPIVFSQNYCLKVIRLSNGNSVTIEENDEVTITTHSITEEEKGILTKVTLDSLYFDIKKGNNIIKRRYAPKELESVEIFKASKLIFNLLLAGGSLPHGTSSNKRMTMSDGWLPNIYRTKKGLEAYKLQNEKHEE